ADRLLRRDAHRLRPDGLRRLPRRGPRLPQGPGGAPANVAVAVARLGGKAAFVGKLGEDEFGRMLAGILEENGAKVFHYGSISLIVEPCRSAHLEAMKAAKEAGALLSYDPNLRLPLWPSPEEAREQIMSIWDKAEVIKVSDVELEFLTGSDKIDDESALSLWHPNLKLLLVTLGEHGCRYYTKSFKGAVDAFRVKTVDTTGAGDAFVGALLCKIVDDQSVIEDEPRLREILKFANACGALSTTKKGAIPALPPESEALALLKRSTIIDKIMSWIFFWFVF
ncbi:hypothetical protein CUMW_242590, partial [Citrus unshiu]